MSSVADKQKITFWITILWDHIYELLSFLKVRSRLEARKSYKFDKLKLFDFLDWETTYLQFIDWKSFDPASVFQNRIVCIAWIFIHWEKFSNLRLKVSKWKEIWYCTLKVSRKELIWRAKMMCHIIFSIVYYSL